MAQYRNEWQALVMPFVGILQGSMNETLSILKTQAETIREEHKQAAFHPEDAAAVKLAELRERKAILVETYRSLSRQYDQVSKEQLRSLYSTY